MLVVEKYKKSKQKLLKPGGKCRKGFGLFTFWKKLKPQVESCSK